MTILHFPHDLALAGVQLMAITVLDHARRLGHETHCATMVDGPARPLLEAAGVPIHMLNSEDELTPLARELGAQVLHGHSCGGGSYACFAAKRLKVVGGETIHSMVTRREPMAGEFEVVHTRMLATGRPGASYIPWGIEPERLAVTKSRAALRAEWGIPDNALVIGRNGRLDGSKLPQHFLLALQQLPGVWGVLSGWGPLAAELKIMAEALNLADRLVMPGLRYDVGNVYNAIDLVVYPTSDESFCAGIVEPMLLAKPVVAYMRGGMSEHLIDGQTGLVASDPPGLVAGVRQYRDHGSWAEGVGRAAQAYCRSRGLADPKGMASQHLKLYRERGQLLGVKGIAA